jgi:predicted aspartyl protease
VILGEVDASDVPVIELKLAGRSWRTIIDTGFNGDLELPDALRWKVDAQYAGQTKSLLAGGRSIVEESFVIAFDFDGLSQIAEVTFVPGDEILLGTQLLQDHRLTIDFVDRTVRLERVASD